MKYKIKILLILTTFLVFSCERSRINISGELKKITDIQYKKCETEYERDRCRLDLYLPVGYKKFPVLVWFYGGGLFQGDKSENHAVGVGKFLASRGIGVVLVNYRLNPEVNFPAYIEDAASAIGWTVKNIKSYKGNTNRIFIGGHSAGAYLSAMASLDKRYLKKYNLTPECLAGIILLSGQMNSHFTVKKERGIPRSEILIDKTAPKFYVSNIKSPFLILVAENDRESTILQNREFINLLHKDGNKHYFYHEITGQNHMSTVLTINDPDNSTGEYIISFINAY